MSLTDVTHPFLANERQNEGNSPPSPPASDASDYTIWSFVSDSTRAPKRNGETAMLM